MNAFYSDTYLREAIESVLAQTYSNWEIILWENNSKDESEAIAASYEDERIRYFFDPTKVSLYKSRVNAVAASSGDVLAFLDCDDTWRPNKLSDQIRLFVDPGIVACCSDYEIARTDGAQVRRRLIHSYGNRRLSLDEVATSYRIGLLTLMVRRSAWEEFIPNNPPDFNILEDFDLVLRVLQAGDLVSLQECLATYRLHASNYSLQTHIHVAERNEWLQSASAWLNDSRLLKEVGEVFQSETNQIQARNALLRGDRAACLAYAKRMRFGRSKIQYLIFGYCIPLFLWPRVVNSILLR